MQTVMWCTRTKTTNVPRLLEAAERPVMATLANTDTGGVRWVPGPHEQAVRDGLQSRLAAIINDTSNKVQGCFAGFFNGCHATGSLWGDDDKFLSIGKAECEWEWRETWGSLKALGLIDWTERTIPAPGAKSGKMTEVHLAITDKGHAVRDDDLKWFRELMNARERDEREGR